MSRVHVADEGRLTTHDTLVERLRPLTAWFVEHRPAILVWSLLAVLAFFVAFHELGGFRTLTRHEAYVAVPARAMLDTGDWIVPRFGGRPRLEKPPLAYWIAASLGHVFGGIDEWTLRFPSALAAVALAGLIGFWGYRRGGWVNAAGAVACQLTCGYVLLYARKAEVDMLLCLMTTSATYLIVSQPEAESGSRSFWRWFAVYVLLGLSWLAKFHYGTAMVVLPFIVYRLVTWRPRRLLSLLNPPGLAVLAASALVWPLLILAEIPDAWEVWNRETVGRAVGGLGHHPTWYYVPYVFLLTFPWCLLVCPIVPERWRRAWREGDPEERYLWVWLIVQFAIVTLSANKHRHYLLATLPVISLWTGTAVAWMTARVREGKPLLNGFFAGTWAVLVALAALMLRRYTVDRFPELAAPISLWITGVVAGIWLTLLLLVQRRNLWAIRAAVASFVTGLACINASLFPRADVRRDDVGFLTGVRRERPADETAHVYGLGTAPQLFYVGEDVVRLETQTEVLLYMMEDRPVIDVVTREDRLPELSEIVRTSVLSTATGESRGEDGGAPLTLVRLEYRP